VEELATYKTMADHQAVLRYSVIASFVTHYTE